MVTNYVNTWCSECVGISGAGVRDWVFINKPFSIESLINHCLIRGFSIIDW